MSGADNTASANEPAVGHAWVLNHEDYIAGLTSRTELIPLYGVRAIACVGENGLNTYMWCYDNESSADQFQLGGLLHAMAGDVIGRKVASMERRDERG